jgi:uncharacterized protein YbjT (DUF2867 family)
LPVPLVTRAGAVLVTGATGRVGRLVVDELLRAGVPVRALTRRPDQAALPAGVEIVGGDLTIPASLDAALEGVDTVFLVWTPAIATAAAVIARLAAQRRRVVHLSSPHQTPHPFFQQPNFLRGLHAEVERLLSAAAIDVVILRPGIFASNALHWWAPQIRNGNVVRWPYAAAETAPIDERDVAAVAARALLDARHAGGDWVLTGPESLSQAAQVRAIGDAIGRPLRFDELSPDEFRRENAGTWPASVADMLLGAWRATLGYPAFVTSAVEEIVGSPPRTFHQWAADNVTAFT